MLPVAAALAACDRATTRAAAQHLLAVVLSRRELSSLRARTPVATGPTSVWRATPKPCTLRSSGMARGPAHLADATSHVIFTNGLLDPWSAGWSAQSVTQNVSSKLVAINIPDGSHHSDLGAPPNPDVSEADSPTLRAARAQQLAILKGWLEERAAPTVAVA